LSKVIFLPSATCVTKCCICARHLLALLL
jgi:hypothetical protein